MANAASTDLEPTESLYFAINDGGLIASKLRARRLTSFDQTLSTPEPSLSSENIDAHQTQNDILTPRSPTLNDVQEEPKIGEIKLPSTQPPAPKAPTTKPQGEEDDTISTLDTVAPYAADRHSTNTIDVVGDFIADLSEKTKTGDPLKEKSANQIGQDEQNDQQIILFNGELSSKLHARRVDTAIPLAGKVSQPMRKLH